VKKAWRCLQLQRIRQTRDGQVGGKAGVRRQQELAAQLCFMMRCCEPPMSADRLCTSMSFSAKRMICTISHRRHGAGYIGAAGRFPHLRSLQQKPLRYALENEKVGGPKELGQLFSTEEIAADFPNYEVTELAEREVELSESLFHNGTGCGFSGGRNNLCSCARV
jgi:hypothetical protein